ncbi:MAG: hypothetical protein H0T79_21210, partial [Deltaproteobacteria bacterium]|nr:hypothetical protein [Deltaproteobacteria bacterium]
MVRLFARLGSFGLVGGLFGGLFGGLSFGAGCDGDAPAVVDAPPGDATDAGPDAGCGLA